jgi:threonine dehydrogenase-like Zn-dependent dehydrogenase
MPERKVVKIPSEDITFNQAAISYISVFPLAAVRKTEVEVGESALVMGLGILGQCAVKYFKVAGAVPVIAVDPNPERREQALLSGADYVLDPTEPNFADKVIELTNGGVNACVEVTGLGVGLNQALDCMAKMGRVALLGCTRDKNFNVDYYRKVHGPGIKLIGAHTAARPYYESHPSYFTVRDDVRSALDLLRYGRMELVDLLKEVHSPLECSEVYLRLATDKNFPICVQFDWSKV